MHLVHLLKDRNDTSIPSKAEAVTASQIQLIRSSTLFAGLKPAAHREIASRARSRIYARDETMFLQGHPIREHVLLQCGIARVTQLNSCGRDLLLWMNGPGEPVGIPNDAPSCWHACSAHAVQACLALTWDDSCFQFLLGKHPQIRVNVARLLAIQLAELQQRFREIVKEEVPMRLSFALLRLATQLGTPINGGIEIPLSCLQLAQLIGATEFAVTSALSKWGKQGLIAPRRHAVIVQDSGRLLLAGVPAAQVSD